MVVEPEKVLKTSKYSKYINFVFDNIVSNKQMLFLFFGSLFLVMLELLSFAFKGGFSVIASRLWLFGWAICSTTIIIFFVKAMVEDIKNKEYIPLIVLGTISILLLFVIGNLEKMTIGQDATQQLTAGLASFKVPDWNYTGKAFLGYPNRQYILAALPSYLFGRSIIALQLGFAYPFYLAIMMFYVGIRNWVKASGFQASVAVLPVAALLIFPYLTEYYIYFEHTLFPTCFTIQAIGWLLLFLKRPNLLHSFGLAWTCAMMSNCYTPAIASLALFVTLISLFGIYSLYPKRNMIFNGLIGKKFLYICMVLASYIATNAVITFLYGRGDRVTDLSSTSIVESLRATVVGYQIFFLNQPAKFAGIFIVIISIYLLLSLTFRFKFINFVIAIWVLGVVGMSQFLKGYAIYPPSISMSRTLVTIPVLVGSITLVTFHLLKRYRININSIVVVTLSVLFLTIGFYNIEKPLVQGDASKYHHGAFLEPMKFLVSDIEKTSSKYNFNTENKLSIVLCTDTVWRMNLLDYTSYFRPNASIIVLKSGEKLPQTVNLKEGAIVYIDDNVNIDAKLKALPNQQKLEFMDDGKPFYKVTRVVVNP